MARTIRLLDTSIPTKKPLYISLTYIYGIGRNRSLLLLKELNWDPNRRIEELSALERLELVKRIDEKKRRFGWLIERDLKRAIEKALTTHIQLGTYKGLRHSMNLPVRGQRTHSNAKTQRSLRRYSSIFSKR